MKTTNNANLNKIMNRKSNKSVVVSMDSLETKITNNVLESIYNGTCELPTLLNVTDKIIDMNKCEYPIKTMQLIYKAGSDVGKVTIQGQNIYMLDVTTDEGFEAFKEGLKMLKDQDKHVPYESVWIEGYNKFTGFNFTTGHHYVYYVVTNAEMKLLAERISSMSKSQITKEEAAAVQADLPPFIRAWQESSIDVSKDKDKVFKMAMDMFFNKVATLSQLTKKFKDDISFGFDNVKEAKHAGKIIPKFAYSNKTVEEANPCTDLMGHVNLALIDTAVNKLNGSISKIYSTSDNSLYEQFINDTQISKELAYFIKSIYRVCYAARTEETKITKEDFALLRDVIYTAALNYGVDQENVIKVAIASAMTTVTKDNEGKITTKDANVNRFKQYPVTSIFPDEFVAAVTDMPIYDTLKPNDTIANITRDIEDNEEITFVDGVSEDGCIELYDTAFNGTLVEYEGNFLYFKDIYAFNVTNALLVDKYTFKEDATKEELMRVKSGDKAACDNGQYLSSVIGSINTATIAGKNANLLIANKHYLCQFTANYEAVKGETVIDKAISYTPDNGMQQLFIMITR